MHFWSPNKKPTGGGGKRKEKKRERRREEGEDQAKVWMLDFAMNFI